MSEETESDAPELVRDILAGVAPSPAPARAAAVAALAAIVADRITTEADDAGTVPYVLVSLVAGGEFLQTQQGTDAWNTRAIEVAAVAGDYATAKTMARLVKAAIDGREDDTFASIEIEGEYDAPQMDDATPLRARVQLYTASLKR